MTKKRLQKISQKNLKLLQNNKLNLQEKHLQQYMWGWYNLLTYIVDVWMTSSSDILVIAVYSTTYKKI